MNYYFVCIMSMENSEEKIRYRHIPRSIAQASVGDVIIQKMFMASDWIGDYCKTSHKVSTYLNFSAGQVHPFTASAFFSGDRVLHQDNFLSHKVSIKRQRYTKYPYEF